MFGLPRGTEFGRRIPKQKFYENLNITAGMKKVFVEQIKAIYWKNKIAPATVNVVLGAEVQELEVFEISLNQKWLDETVLFQIDREIPYHILFLLSFEGQYQAWIGYKEAASYGVHAFKVSSYYHTDWVEKDKLHFHIEGLSMDAVYENFVRQIAGDALKGQMTDDLKDAVEKDRKRKELERQILAIQSKIRKEKQLNRQMELRGEEKRMRKEWEGLG